MPRSESLTQGYEQGDERRWLDFFFLSYAYGSFNPNGAGLLYVAWMWGHNVPTPSQSTQNTVKNQKKKFDFLKFIMK